MKIYVQSKDNKRKVCLQIDMSLPTDNKISVKEYNKISEYKDLEIEILKMWHLETTTTPVILGVQGMIKKRINKNVPRYLAF